MEQEKGQQAIQGKTSSLPGQDNPYMMEEKILEVRAKRKGHGRFITQFYACITVTLGTINFGFVQGTSAPFLRNRYDESKASGKEDTYSKGYATIVPVGFLIATLAMLMVSYRIGPRLIMVIVVPINFLTWLLFSISDNETWRITVICACAILSLMNSKCGKTLLVDAIHPRNLYYFQWVSFSGTGFGIMLGYIFGYSYDLSYYVTGIPILILGIQFVLLFFCPESPVHLYPKHPLLAERALVFFRGPDVALDLRVIAKDCENRNLSISAKYMLMRKAVYKAAIIIAVLTAFKALSGYALFLLVDVSIWKSSEVFEHLDSLGKSEDAMILGLCHFLVPVIVYLFLSRIRYNVKATLMVSAAMVTLSLAIKSVHLLLLEAKNPLLVKSFWPHICIRALLIVSYHIGYGICLEIILNDYIPDEVQTRVTAMIKIFQYALIFVLVRIIISLEVIHGAVAIMVLAVISFGGILFCHYCVINAGGKTLKQVQLELGGNPIGTHSISRRLTGKYGAPDTNNNTNFST